MKISDLLQEVELIDSDDIPKSDKSWAEGSSMLGKKMSDRLLKSASIKDSGALSGGKWILFDATHKDFSGPNRDMGFKWFLVALTPDNKVQCIANMTRKGATYSVEQLVGKNKSKIPAHELYAAFIRAGNVLTTSAQSEGGLKVWQKLSRMPGIVVHGWNLDTEKPINLGHKFDDTSDTHSNIRTKWDAQDAHDKEQADYEDHIMHNVILVASQKGNKKLRSF